MSRSYSSWLSSFIIILSGIALCPAAEATTGVNLAPVAEPSTSHVSRDTSLAALHDGHAPKTSHVRGKGSYGNWPSKGTQWVQYDWTAPVRTRKIDVFWWDDRGGVRLPKACRLLYWDGKRFVPVRNPSGLGVAKDKFNTTTFDEVRTSKLRLEIDGNGDYSTGILEWKVYNEGELPNFPPSVKAGVDRIVMLGRKTHVRRTVVAGDIYRHDEGHLEQDLGPGQGSLRRRRGIGYDGHVLSRGRLCSHADRPQGKDERFIDVGRPRCRQTATRYPCRRQNRGSYHHPAAAIPKTSFPIPLLWSSETIPRRSSAYANSTRPSNRSRQEWAM